MNNEITPNIPPIEAESPPDIRDTLSGARREEYIKRHSDNYDEMRAEGNLTIEEVKAGTLPMEEAKKKDKNTMEAYYSKQAALNEEFSQA